jgi:folate-binding protein YgfZ
VARTDHADRGDHALGDALDEGRAFVDLSAWRKVEVSGDDAWHWLDDLLTADLSALEPGAAAHALLLGPTGRIRADVTVARTVAVRILLLQDPAQPDPVDRLLAPYVLSAGVDLHDRTDELCLFALPNAGTAPEVADADRTQPSCLGPGTDLTAPAAERDRLQASLSASLSPATLEQADAWRIRRGLPRFGVDALPEDLPQEGGLDDAVSADKGCFPGQEAVAKVRNLGHPRRIVLHVVADAPLTAGEPVLHEGTEVGVVTSVAAADGAAVVALARVGWKARTGPLATGRGVALRPANEP